MVKILLVEDDPLMQQLIRLYLKKYTNEIDVAGNGRIALKRMNKRKYDILITDLQMPEMDGTTLVRTIRNNGDMIPVIVLSSYDKEQVEKMINEPYVDSLRKPFESSALIQLLGSFIEIE